MLRIVGFEVQGYSEVILGPIHCLAPGYLAQYLSRPHGKLRQGLEPYRRRTHTQTWLMKIAIRPICLFLGTIVSVGSRRSLGRIRNASATHAEYHYSGAYQPRRSGQQYTGSVSTSSQYLPGSQRAGH